MDTTIWFNRKIIRILLILLTEICVLHSASGAQDFDVRVISSRPDTVSGGDVLVEVRAPNGSNWIAQLNGRKVTQ